MTRVQYITIHIVQYSKKKWSQSSAVGGGCGPGKGAGGDVGRVNWFLSSAVGGGGEGADGEIGRVNWSLTSAEGCG